MTFTGGQFRDKYEIEPRTWSINLHSVTEYFYFTGITLSKLIQIIFYKNGVKMIRSIIKYSLLFNLFSLSLGQVDYNSDIQPIFNSACTSCHGNSAGLNLSSYDNVMMGANNGDVVIPYDHASSELWIRINSGQMPPGNNDLTNEQVNLIAQWIDEGALEQPGSSSGCTDPEAYNCSDDVWIDGNEYPNYTATVGAIVYVNGCNYYLDDFLNIAETTDNNCEDGPCEGYYNSDATTDDGSCDYYQAPHGDDVVFTVEENGINIDWTDWADNAAPENATIIAYHVQRCTENCIFITESSGPPQNSPFSCWPDCPIQHTDTFVYDNNPWDPDMEIKYAINVQYSNAEQYGMAIGASYITPGICPAVIGDVNGDSGWNVLDIVTLANCVLAENCGPSSENWVDFDCGENAANPGTANCYGCAADTSGDGGWNVLDIVLLANCVLAQNCGG